ncbi:MAG: nicotinamidase [Planctomycetaceae bacterium]|nr:nicotinamidase [Planctomycetaceae bacterium]
MSRIEVVRRLVLAFVIAIIAGLFWQPGPATAGEMLELKTRERIETEKASGKFETVSANVKWDADKTAVVICDMWARHWCRGASQRGAEMAPRMNEVVMAARNKGALIIHCPSSGMEYYKDTPMRKLAQSAPKVETKIPLQGWCSLDEANEAALPIDDRDGGCDCWPACSTKTKMDLRQTTVIEMKEGDAITDSAEAYYLMKQRGITNVIVMGVHTNMCVLGRPFSIRQMKYQGQNVLLMRDMTDTMYNSRSKPYVPHVKGTDLVVEHIEKYWCPTITSTDFTGKPVQTFAEANRPHVVFMIGEREYETRDSLPKFAKEQLEPGGIRSTIIHADADDKNNFPGLLSLKTADLLFVSVRRRSLPEDQLALVREYAGSGRPIIGIRTASHAFDTKGKHPEGHAEWRSFDPEVLGGNYHGHRANGVTSTLKAAKDAGKHPILQGVSLDSFIGHGSLYQVAPLAKTATSLVIGTIPEHPSEPVAWTHQYKNSRVFYTSLGQIDDFKSPEFNRLLTNAVFWALNKPAPAITQ